MLTQRVELAPVVLHEFNNLAQSFQFALLTAIGASMQVGCGRVEIRLGFDGGLVAIASPQRGETCQPGVESQHHVARTTSGEEQSVTRLVLDETPGEFRMRILLAAT